MTRDDHDLQRHRWNNNLLNSTSDLAFVAPHPVDLRFELLADPLAIRPEPAMIAIRTVKLSNAVNKTRANLLVRKPVGAAPSLATGLSRHKTPSGLEQRLQPASAWPNYRTPNAIIPTSRSAQPDFPPTVRQEPPREGKPRTHESFRICGHICHPAFMYFPVTALPRTREPCNFRNLRQWAREILSGMGFAVKISEYSRSLADFM